MEFWEYIHQPWIYAVLSATYALSIITVIVVILGENRNPVKSLAWVTILLLMPAVGLVLYIFFGRNVKNKRMISRRNKRRLRRAASRHGGTRRPRNLDIEATELARLTTTLTGAPFYRGNSVEFFSSGKEKFEALKRDLRAAEHYINFQYYIFENDTIGTEIAAILEEKARSGVRVRVIYDHVGSWHVSSHFFKDMRAAGVEAYPFFKVTFIPLASKVNWRNHRKMVIIDDKIGYIGGMNVADRYISGGKKFDLWRDCHVRLTGPAVAALQYSFARDWNFMGRELIEDELPPTEESLMCGTVGIQTITGGPMSHWNNIASAFLRAISAAHHRVWIQTPYLLPPESLLKALQTSALSGVDVRLMMPRHSDSVMLGLASRSYIDECLRAGIKIYFFEPGMLHSKVLIIDEDICSVGSTNFDFRSFEHNFEGNLIIYSKEATERLSGIFLADQQQSTRVIPSEWRRRPRVQRALESVLRLLSPIL